jgi:hypothetical protein
MIHFQPRLVYEHTPEPPDLGDHLDQGRISSNNFKYSS